jgi:hypothetical protein
MKITEIIATILCVISLIAIVVGIFLTLELGPALIASGIVVAIISLAVI